MARRILLADDSITIQKVVELTFSEGDYEVLSVSNGQQAIQKIPEWRPDIALLDVIMPEKSGYEVCHEIKKDPRHQNIPVLLLTGTFEPFDADRAKQSGADGHITKPFESRALVAKVEELLSALPAENRSPAGTATAISANDTAAGMLVDAGNPKQEVREETPDWVADDFAQETSPSQQTAGGIGQPAAPPIATSITPTPGDPQFPVGRPAVEWGPADREAPPRQGLSSDIGLETPASPIGHSETGSQTQTGEEDLSRTMRIELPDLSREPLGDNSTESADGPPQGNIESSTGESENQAVSPDPLRIPDLTSTGEEQAGADPGLLDLESPTPELSTKKPTWNQESAVGSDTSGELDLTPTTIDAIARKVVEKLSDQIIREIAWEVVPDLAETLIRKRIQELEQQAGEE